MTHDRLRLFFALPCPEPVAETLTAWSRANCPDGRALHPADLHITLAFLGSQPAERLPTLTALAERLPLPGFELELALLERWSDLLVLMPGQAPTALLEFQTSLLEHLQAAGVTLEQRAYRPHLTLVRRLVANYLPNPAPQVAWPVREWGLYRSVEQQPRYQCLARWPTVSGRNSSPAP